MSLTAWFVLAAIVFAMVLLWRRRPDERKPQELSDERDDSEPLTAPVGKIDIEDAIDLHGFQPREIPAVVESYLEAAVAKGFVEVRLIHGKGKGVQRRRVRELLANHSQVQHFTDAPAHRGGWGSTLVTLKQPRRPKR